MRRGSIQGRAGAGARALADTNESRRGAVADGRVRWATSASLRPESAREYSDYFLSAGYGVSVTIGTKPRKFGIGQLGIFVEAFDDVSEGSKLHRRVSNLEKGGVPSKNICRKNSLKGILTRKFAELTTGKRPNTLESDSLPRPAPHARALIERSEPRAPRKHRSRVESFPSFTHATPNFPLLLAFSSREDPDQPSAPKTRSPDRRRKR